MSETTSNIRRSPPAPQTGSTSEQPTVITSRAPVPAPAASDSTCRILEGRVMPGDCLGHFELVEYVGGGGMGRVFRAIDTQLGRTVALKVLPPEQAADPDALQRFKNEAQSAAKLDHDNIARAYYVGEDRGLHYIVFEFIEGLNIRALVERKGPLPLAEAVGYALQVAEALAHADARSVVHRDIKPSNVLITPDGRVKLIDLGLARMRHVDPAAADLTASGVTLGTFDYISPEQARDPRNADIRSDIYSLGCTVFFMLAGQPPFPEGTVLQKLLQHQGDQPPDIRQFRPELPDEISRILRKMMAKDPRHRYAGPADLVADLLPLADQIGLRPLSPSSRVWLVPQEPPVSLLQRNLPWAAPIVALVGVVLLLDRYWSASGPRDEPAATTAVVTPTVEPGPVAPVTGPRPKPTVAKSADRQTTPSVKDSTPSTKRRSEQSGKEAKPPAEPSVASKTKPAPPAAKTEKRQRVLVVGTASRGEDQFATLGAACAAARDGDVIELCFNGPRESRPLKISNLRLTISAGDGYRPTVVFSPGDADPVKTPRGMCMLASGQLTVNDVAFELHVPLTVPAEKWSLFEIRGGQTLRLQRCLLTVYNASEQRATYHPDVAFFRARAALDAEGDVGGLATATPLISLDLTDCIARGEADLLRVEDLQPVQLSWDNGLLLSSESLLRAEGGETPPKLDEVLRVELRRLTAVTRGGLCRLNSTAATPYQLTTQFVSADCIFIGSPGTPLIRQDGIAPLDSYRQRFLWNGEGNYYQDIDVFWTVRTLEFESPSEVMTFGGWTTYWGPSREKRPSIEKLLWRHGPNAGHPLHDQGPADYTLEDPTFGDTTAGAPGCRMDQLPHVPYNSAQHRSGWPASAQTDTRPQHPKRG